ncbi:MAG: hypothetical protein KBT27_02685 [Prevotellaceae bacterium]|nr:hypothetical protein [Candidatus Faecinaster equi]
MTIFSNSSNTNHSTAFFAFSKGADEIVIASPFCYPDFVEFANSIKAAGAIGKIVFITTAKKEFSTGSIVRC